MTHSPSAPDHDPSVPPNVPISGSPPGAPPGSVSGVATTDPSPVPADLPRKFWDPSRKQVRLEALVRSYIELERRLSSGAATPSAGANGADPEPAGRGRVPERPEDYRIEILEDYLQSDSEVNAILHAAGFTEEQAQLVYDLAAEKLAPVAQALAARAAGASDAARLEAHFGGPERWAEVRHQLRRWAERKLPHDAYKALVSTYEGVLALHRMMERKEEPSPLGEGDPATATLNETQLRRKMRDPRYWRDRDPTILREVTEGFKRLYPGG